MNAQRLVFIDESYCKTGMCREHAWSTRGTRAAGSRPGRSWKTVSLIGAIRLGERPRLMTHRGSVNGAVFLRYVKRCLVPCADFAHRDHRNRRMTITEFGHCDRSEATLVGPT
jgi:hypothetical protein